jgi:NCS1 family nucleobase:cation symporter-1
VIIVAKFLLALLALSQGWLGGEWHVGYTVSQRYLIFISA